MKFCVTVFYPFPLQQSIIPRGPHFIGVSKHLKGHLDWAPLSPSFINIVNISNIIHLCKVHSSSDQYGDGTLSCQAGDPCCDCAVLLLCCCHIHNYIHIHLLYISISTSTSTTICIIEEHYPTLKILEYVFQPSHCQKLN